jgi:predicted HicB family RNase H-like nuclease
MANINIEIPDELHKEIKLRAVMEDISLKDYVIKNLENKIKK